MGSCSAKEIEGGAKKTQQDASGQACSSDGGGKEDRSKALDDDIKRIESDEPRPNHATITAAPRVNIESVSRALAEARVLVQDYEILQTVAQVTAVVLDKNAVACQPEVSMQNKQVMMGFKEELNICRMQPNGRENSIDVRLRMKKHWEDTAQLYGAIYIFSSATSWFWDETWTWKHVTHF